MIIFLSGPSGIGKTDTSFSLMSSINNSVYLDSDWFCAKNPFDVFTADSIKQVYDSIYSNINYQKKLGYKNFIIAIYLEAFIKFYEYQYQFAALDEKVYTFILSSTTEIHIKRIKSRDRLSWMKENEIKKSNEQLKISHSMASSNPEIVDIDTTSMNPIEVAQRIIEAIENKKS